MSGLEISEGTEPETVLVSIISYTRLDVHFIELNLDDAKTAHKRLGELIADIEREA